MMIVSTPSTAERYLALPWHWQCVWSEEDEVYVATIAELPGFAGVGDSRDDALSDARAAFVAHIGAHLATGTPIPEPEAVLAAARGRQGVVSRFDAALV